MMMVPTALVVCLNAVINKGWDERRDNVYIPEWWRGQRAAGHVHTGGLCLHLTVQTHCGDGEVVCYRSPCFPEHPRSA